MVSAITMVPALVYAERLGVAILALVFFAIPGFGISYVNVLFAAIGLKTRVFRAIFSVIHNVAPSCVALLGMLVTYSSDRRLILALPEQTLVRAPLTGAVTAVTVTWRVPTVAQLWKISLESLSLACHMFGLPGATRHRMHTILWNLFVLLLTGPRSFYVPQRNVPWGNAWNAMPTRTPNAKAAAGMCVTDAGRRAAILTSTTTRPSKY